MDIDLAYVYLVGALALVAIIRFAPAAILIVGFAVLLAGPSLEKVVAHPQSKTSCTSEVSRER